MCVHTIVVAMVFVAVANKGGIGYRYLVDKCNSVILLSIYEYLLSTKILPLLASDLIVSKMIKFFLISC